VTRDPEPVRCGVLVSVSGCFRAIAPRVEAPAVSQTRGLGRGNTLSVPGRFGFRAHDQRPWLQRGTGAEATVLNSETPINGAALDAATTGSTRGYPSKYPNAGTDVAGSRLQPGS